MIGHCQSWFGLGVQFPNLGQTEIVNAVSSDLLAFLARCLPDAQVTPLAVEIGTVPLEESFPIFVAENFLHHYPDREAFLGDARSLMTSRGVVRQKFESLFYPPANYLSEDDKGNEWSAAARAGFMPIFRTVVRGLSE